MTPSDPPQLFDDEHFNPSRLELIRQRRGLSASALGKLVDVTPRSVARWEDGAASPTAENLVALSDKLNVPSDFFLAAELDTVSHAAISFRALSKMTARQRDAATAAGALGVAFSAWIDLKFRLPSPDLPTLEGYAPEHAAAVVRERWGLGTAPISNLVHLLEAHGVRVFSLAGDIATVDAFSFRLDSVPYVFLNTSKTGERRRFDAAHELGHLVLHCGDEIPHGREAEAQAQTFASAFLMPAQTVIAAGLHQASIDAIVTAKAHWGVAAMALTHRLRELELLTEWGYRDACVRLTQMGYRRGEPKNSIVPEVSQALRKVLVTLRSHGVTTAEIAAELSLNRSELDDMVFGLVPTLLDGGAGIRRSSGVRPALSLVRAPGDRSQEL